MTAKKRTGDDTEAEPELVDAELEMPTSWQERTIERRLSAARARALARSSRFLATALEQLGLAGYWAPRDESGRPRL